VGGCSSLCEDQDVNQAILQSNQVVELNKIPAGLAQQKSKLLIGEFLVYGDQIAPNLAIAKGGQIIHINNQKITLRLGQPIFVSPQAILHKYDGDFVDEQSSVITLAYQQLKTGDIVQGIPKIEQFFEARTTKRGRLFKDSLENLLKAIFNRYNAKLSREQAVRQSFYKIQQIIIDGVQRVYRSQGVTIADKHLEVIVKQMTSKVRITFGGSTGYLPGEICDLYDIESLNKELRPKIMYEPIVLVITKASLEEKSFLSAASFQQTTRVLSKAALSRKNDYLNGLKENVILGNLIPAGTGYLVYLDQSILDFSRR
jgi:DNA-directed RNA polymerase subunit beta'